MSTIYHLFPKMAPAFLGVTETIKILQPLINFLTRTLIQMRILLLYMRKYGILANRKSLMCIALPQTCLFLFSNIFRMYARKTEKQYKL